MTSPLLRERISRVFHTTDTNPTRVRGDRLCTWCRPRLAPVACASAQHEPTSRPSRAQHMLTRGISETELIPFRLDLIGSSFPGKRAGPAGNLLHPASRGGSTISWKQHLNNIHKELTHAFLQVAEIGQEQGAIWVAVTKSRAFRPQTSGSPRFRSHGGTDPAEHDHGDQHR